MYSIFFMMKSTVLAIHTIELFEMFIQNRHPKFRSLSLFVLTFHEYKARFVYGFRLDYQLSLFNFFVCVCQIVLCIMYVL